MNPSNPFWKQERVLVTGGAGFLGSFVVEKLQARGPAELFTPRSQDYDLRKAPAIDNLLKDTRPSMIIHLAAVCGGIGANQAEPGRFVYENAIMGLQLMEAARVQKVGKFVQLGTVCAYPGHTPVPFKEKDLWNGYPEPTNAPYGIAKKLLLVQAQSYRAQYGFNAIYLLPANLYGPRDHFNLTTSHVVPALIQKIYEAKQNGHPSIEVWGTGKPTREFLYAGDAAEGILLAAEKYNDPEPMNLGTGSATSIKQLTATLCRLMDFRGKIVWNKSRPDGQMKRRLDISRAKRALNFKAETSLEKGLQQTIAWYEAQKEYNLAHVAH